PSLLRPLPLSLFDQTVAPLVWHRRRLLTPLRVVGSRFAEREGQGGRGILRLFPAACRLCRRSHHLPDLRGDLLPRDHALGIESDRIRTRRPLPAGALFHPGPLAELEYPPADHHQRVSLCPCLSEDRLRLRGGLRARHGQSADLPRIRSAHRTVAILEGRSACAPLFPLPEPSQP